MKSLSRIFRLFSPILQLTVRGRSMEPTYKEGDRIIVNRLAYFFSKPKIGDIVAIKHPFERRVILKRVIRVLNKQVFVAGDNFKKSIDSEQFGFINYKNIIGKIIQNLA